MNQEAQEELVRLVKEGKVLGVIDFVSYMLTELGNQALVTGYNRGYAQGIADAEYELHGAVDEEE